MTALEEFVKEVNCALFINALGEQISFKTSKNKTITGDFLAINIGNLNDILYHDDLICMKKRFNIKKSLEENEKNEVFKDTKLGKINLSSLTNYDDNDDNDKSQKTEDEFLYFCFKNIQIKGAKQASSKFIIILKMI